MLRHRSCLGILAILISIATHNAVADVQIAPKGGAIDLYGEISRADAAKVATAFREHVRKGHPEYSVNVLLDSPGGDVEAAMAIGRLLRAWTANVQVLMPLPFHSSDWTPLGPSRAGMAECASACVLLLAAGTDRFVGGRVGIHRPYSISLASTDSPKSAVTSRAAYTALVARVKSYLEEMGMPNRLYDEMMQVLPEQVRWLDPRQASDRQALFDLGLDGKDAAYNDSQDSIEASNRGISKQEWLRRKALVKPACFNDWYSALQKVGVDAEKSYPINVKFNECKKRVEDTGRP